MQWIHRETRRKACFMLAKVLNNPVLLDSVIRSCSQVRYLVGTRKRAEMDIESISNRYKQETLFSATDLMPKDL